MKNCTEKTDLAAFERSLNKFKPTLSRSTKGRALLLELGDFQDTDGSFRFTDYAAEWGLLYALRIFHPGKLSEFLVSSREVCPEFHALIWNILDEQDETIRKNRSTITELHHDYMNEWKKTISAIKPKKRLYLAYGSNMASKQMLRRCPEAKLLGKTYVKDWKLEFYHFANIELGIGRKTPAIIWEILANDEKTLDGCEGFPTHYRKNNLVVELGGISVSVMAYVMTKKKKTEDWRAGLPPKKNILIRSVKGTSKPDLLKCYLKTIRYFRSKKMFQLTK